METNFDAALAAFVAHANNLQTDWATSTVAEGGNPTLPRDTIGFSVGKKFINVFRCNYGDVKSRSGYCMVEIATGNVLKCAGWGVAAKGVRGSIFTPENYGITKYGAVYNR